MIRSREGFITCVVWHGDVGIGTWGVEREKGG